jgi:site-specific DNA recombinase
MAAGKKKQTIYWNGSSVRKILENPHYTGDLVQGRETTISVTNTVRKENSEFIVVKNTHEAIIPRDFFDTVQQLIEANRKKSPDYNSFYQTLRLIRIRFILRPFVP